MAGLHKFKLFAAAHCGLDAAAAAVSPTKSHVFHLRRRKTLRMLFDHTPEVRRRNLRYFLDGSPESDRSSGKSKMENRTRRKLKELLVTSPSPSPSPSPPFEDRENGRDDGEERRDMFRAPESSGGEFVPRRTGSIRGLRYRIMRKPWRPVLVSIPEQ